MTMLEWTDEEDCCAFCDSNRMTKREGDDNYPIYWTLCAECREWTELTLKSTKKGLER